MSSNIQGAAPELSPLRKALLSIEKLQARVRRLEGERTQPIAIVGIGCRMPGGGVDAESFFASLASGVDAIRPLPPVERPGWPTGSEATDLPPAGYLDVDLRAFDAPFFGISPREAESIDPQHRLLLECAWEALEDAGIDPGDLAGTRTGVFLGMAGNDYANMQLRSERAERLLHSHFASGTGHSMASGRLSYLLGLHGPAITVDTACSSSLVAVHLACQSLRGGESDTAIAAGVNLILVPDYTRAFHQARMLAPDGRCKTFDAAADGFSRAEGCGVLLLKRLEDARRDGDRVLATIRGTAVNQDGPSSGLTAPNGPAQESVIRAALANAGLRPADIGYIEAHGTGTSLGDPIEVQALGAVFGEDRTADDPLLIGSVKSNVGHLEAAAGVAGIIKMVAALRHRSIPGNLHFETPSPHIPWGDFPLSVTATTTPFEARNGARRAGVSSFGFSGTNAHVILEEAQEAARETEPPSRPRVLTLSASEPAALRTVAQRMAAHLDETTANLADVCYTANAGRAHLPHRLALRAETAGEAARTLGAWIHGEESEGFLRAGTVESGDPPALAFLFTGQGAQQPGMGWSLRESSPVFRRVLDECDDLLRGQIEVPLLALLDPDRSESELVHRTDLTQPAIFALQVALAELWRSWGVRPGVVLGHSIGEYAAAHLAGVFTLPDALRVVAARGRLMHEVSAAGRMLAVIAAEDRVRALLEEFEADVSIAAINAPGQIVVSGSSDAIAALEARAAAEGVQTRELRTSQAFHSPLMDGVVPALEAVLREVTLRPADRVRFVSTVTGAAVVPDALADPHYWSTQVRLPVRYADAVRTASALAVCGVELGPHPTLAGLAALGGVAMPVHASLHRDHDAWATMMAAVAELHVGGTEIDWAHVEPGIQPVRVALPSYPFQREPLWVDLGSMERGRARRGGRPLLGARLPQPGSEIAFESLLEADAPAFIGDHRVLGRAILPGTAFLEMGLAAGHEALGGRMELRDVELLEPMSFEEGGRLVHTRVDPGERRFSVHSAPAADPAAWTLHCTGTLAVSEAEPGAVDLEGVRGRCASLVDGAAYSAGLRGRGYDFGPRLLGVREIRAGAGEAVGRVALPIESIEEGGDYIIHPLLLDAAVQTIGAALEGEAAGRTWVPFFIERVVADGGIGTEAQSCVMVGEQDATTLRADVALADEAGAVVVRIEGVRFRELSRASADRDRFLEVRWVPVAPDHGGAAEARAEAARTAELSMTELARSEGAATYDEFVESLEAASGAYAADALVRLGFNPVAGDAIEAEGLAVRLGVVPGRVRLLARMLEMLAENGVLEAGERPGVWRAVRSITEADRMQPPSGVSEVSPAAERVLLDRCGPALTDMLRGRGDPLELLFPAGGSADAEAMYYDAPFARIFNRTVAAIVAAAAAAHHGERPLRVLEVGGGTAGTSRRVLDRLDADGQRVEYTFTDISPLFLERARRRWSERDDIIYRTFDLDREIEEQGLEQAAYDVVIAANCLHAARDLAGALSRVRALLRPGGTLAAVEVFGPHRWFDLTVGLTDGWWHFTDTGLRPTYPCPDAATWREVLDRVGFDDASARPLAEVGQSTGFASRNQGIVLAHRGAARADGKLWLVTGVGDAVERTAAGLAARGREVVRAVNGRFGDALREQDRWAGVVVCEEGTEGRLLDVERIRAAVRRGNETLREVAVAVGTGAVFVEGLFIVSRGTQMAVASDIDIDPAGATVWGTARTLELELPEISVRRLDLAASEGRGDIDSVLDWLLDPTGEPELAHRFGSLHGRRLARRASAPASASAALPEEYRLDPPAGGSLDALAFAPGQRRAPAKGEVEVRIAASAMNFKDVLSVLGMYPGDPGPLGSEWAGIVSAVGDGVTLEVGTPVMGAAGHAYGKHVIADARMVARKPEAMTFAQAAGLPIAYLTAAFALEHLGRLSAGDRVLIHAAAGGVGLAAVALAQRAGAEIFATAGNEEKRALLRDRGVPHVFDSRSGSFADDVMRVTGGEGVDVVLNSLSDDLIDRTFDVIRHGGRFLEIGKRGIWSEERVAALGRDIEYHIIDWGETAREDPDLVGRLFGEVMRAAVDGALPALPTTVFPLEKAADAFRFMAQGRHIGKIVLAHPVLEGTPPIEVQETGAYLITGGTGGLGLSTAEWLVDRGARELILVSRRPPSPQNEERIANLREAGATVQVLAVDVGDAAAVSRMVDELRAAGVERVRGVIHSAGALADRTLQQAEWSDFEAVFAAKVYGTVLIDRALREFDPEFFLCYSSVASVLGAPGQANHAAASAFEDSFAATRWSRGQTGMTIGWGPWSETGAATRADVLERTRDRGLTALGTAEGLRWLGQAFAHPAPYLVGTKVADAAALGRAGNPFLSGMISTSVRSERAGEAQGSAATAPGFLEELLATPADAQRGVLLNRIRARIRRVLGLSSTATLDASRPLGEIGLDSLLAVELRNVLAEDVAQRLPATLLFDHATPAALADHLLSLVAPAEPEPVPAPDVQPDSALGLVDALESLDDDDIDRLLAEKLKS